MAKEYNKIVTLPVIVRKKEGKPQILTQVRHVLNKDYDPLYDNTHEISGETLNPWENIIEATYRGVEEEAGCPRNMILKIIGGDNETYFSTGRKNETGEKDKILGLSPYYFCQQLKGPQPWAGLVFVVVVFPDFEPKLDKEGEVSGFQWWTIERLSEKLKKSPERFMGLHYPALVKVCKDLATEKLKI